MRYSAVLLLGLLVLSLALPSETFAKTKFSSQAAAKVFTEAPAQPKKPVVKKTTRRATKKYSNGNSPVKCTTNCPLIQP